MTSKLRGEAGASILNKITQMLNDIATAKETQKDFDDIVKNTKEKLPCEMSIVVLTQGSWPKIEGNPIPVPDELRDIASIFEKNYLKKFHGRKLIWHMDQGKSDMKFRGAKNALYQVEASNYQMMIFLKLNQNPEGMNFKKL